MLQCLKAVAKHWPIVFGKHGLLDVDEIVGRDAENVCVVRRVMDFAECHAVRHLGASSLVSIFENVCRIKKRRMPETAHRAAVLVRIQDELAELTLVQPLFHRDGMIAAFQSKHGLGDVTRLTYGDRSANRHVSGERCRIIGNDVRRVERIVNARSYPD